MNCRASFKFQVLGAISICLLSSSNAFAEKIGKPLAVLNKWFALGSGCKANWETKGDVSVEAIASTSANVHQMRFSMQKFKFDVGAETSFVPKKSDAKECALRINVNPPANKRVKFVTTMFSLVESKPAGAELTSLSELKIGTDTLFRNIQQSLATESFANRVRQVQMIPGTQPDENFPKLECGQAKIISVNMTYIAKRSEKTQALLVELGDGKTLDLVVDLEDCAK